MEGLISENTFYFVGALYALYALFKIEQHLSMIKYSLDVHQINVEEILRDISSNTYQTIDAVEDLKP